jgi:hypothetical protein
MLSTDTLDVILRALESRDCRPKPCRSGWRAKCPSHQDHQPSLSVSVGDSGAILLRCFAGCGVEEICAALGISVSDLFPPNADRPKRPLVERHERTNGRVYPTAEAALKILCDKLGTPTGKWEYFNRSGALVGVVCRWDTRTGKIIRPIAKTASGWVIGAMPEPRPLYGLKRLLEADPATPVFVLEGEKATDAAARCNLLSVTSAGGANAADRTDWCPLRGRRCIVVPDYDESGLRYCDDVVRLCRAAGAQDVRVLRLWEYAPAMQPGDDLFDVLHDPAWRGIGLSETATPADLGRLLLSLAEQLPPAAEESQTRPDPTPADDLAPKPFPLSALPDVLRAYVSALSECTMCDVSMVALPVLCTCAAAIGGTRVLELKKSWRVPSSLWGMLVARSGQLKSPVLSKVTAPVFERQRDLLKQYDDERRQYERECEIWEREHQEWRRRKGNGPPPARPIEPVPKRIVTGDVTVEALAVLLHSNPRGVLVTRDELTGLLASFDRYSNKSRANGDLAMWLTLYSAAPIVVDRKTGPQRTITVQRPVVSIIGSLQPDVLRRTMGHEYRDAGLLARFLVVLPPERPRQWTDDDLCPDIEARYARLINDLYGLAFGVDANGEAAPQVVRLSNEARDRWINFFNEHNREAAHVEGDLASAMAKLEEATARIALVLHCVKWCLRQTGSADVLDAATMEAAIELGTWFRHEARRVHNLFDTDEQARTERRLIEWLRRCGRPVTVRETQRACKWLGTAENVEAVLQTLAERGIGHWEQSPVGEEGGRPTRVFVLSPNNPPAVTKP